MPYESLNSLRKILLIKIPLIVIVQTATIVLIYYSPIRHQIKKKNLNKLACIRQTPSLPTEPGLNSKFIVKVEKKFQQLKKN
jgi:hypothetical protein